MIAELRRKSDLCMVAARAVNDPIMSLIWAKHAYTLMTEALRMERGWHRPMQEIGTTK